VSEFQLHTAVLAFSALLAKFFLWPSLLKQKAALNGGVIREMRRQFDLHPDKYEKKNAHLPLHDGQSLKARFRGQAMTITSPASGQLLVANCPRPFDPREEAGSWFSLTNESGWRIFSLLLPSSFSRESTLLLIDSLNSRFRTTRFKLELSGMPETLPGDPLKSGWWRAACLQLMAVVLVSCAFAAGGAKCQGGACAGIGGTPVMDLWLASGSTMPWLAYVIVMPVSLALGDDIFLRGLAGSAYCLMKKIPWAMIAGAVMAAVLGIFLPRPHAIGTDSGFQIEFITSSVLHLLLALMMVHVFAQQKHKFYIGAWAAYALVLAAMPEVWFLPPLAACAVLSGQFFSDARTFGRLADPEGLKLGSPSLKWTQIKRGLVLGSIFWGDKILILFLFPEMATGGHNATQFLAATLPAIILCNWYFLRLAPGMTRMWTIVFKAMSESSVPVFQATRKNLSVMFLGMCLELFIAVQVAWIFTLGLFAWQFPSEIDQYRMLIYSSGLSSLVFILACHLYQLNAEGPAVAFVIAQMAILGAFLFQDQIEPTFELFNIIAFVGAGIGVIWMLLPARRATSLPEYAAFWRAAADW